MEKEKHNSSQGYVGEEGRLQDYAPGDRVKERRVPKMLQQYEL